MEQLSFFQQQNRRPTSIESIDIVDGSFMLFHAWLDTEQADRDFHSLLKELAWEQSRVNIRGRRLPIPRLNAWYGDLHSTYSYSGVSFKPHPWTARLLALKHSIEKATDQLFNSVLANLYRDGSDGVAWHSDDEPELGSNPAIASLSLGATRRFVLRHKYNKSVPKVDIPLASGSLLLMSDQTQHNWFHQIPKTRKKIGPRINLTFRRVHHEKCTYAGYSEESLEKK